MYRYFMCGMFNGTDGKTYDIDIPSPFTYETKEEAMKDGEFAYRFISTINGPEIVLFEKEGLKRDGDGINVWVEGDIVARINWDMFVHNGGKIRQFKGKFNGGFVDDDDFVETTKTFSDIFPNMEKGKLYYIDNEAYIINKIN